MPQPREDSIGALEVGGKLVLDLHNQFLLPRPSGSGIWRVASLLAVPRCCCVRPTILQLAVVANIEGTAIVAMAIAIASSEAIPVGHLIRKAHSVPLVLGVVILDGGQDLPIESFVRLWCVHTPVRACIPECG